MHTIFTPRRNSAEAEKASPRLFKNPSMTSGKWPPNAKFPIIPKNVITANEKNVILKNEGFQLKDAMYFHEFFYIKSTIFVFYCEKNRNKIVKSLGRNF